MVTLPIRLQGNLRPICQRTFSFFEVPVGTDPTTQLYKSRIFPVKLRDQFKTKNPGLLDPGLSLLYLMIRYIVLLNERHEDL